MKIVEKGPLFRAPWSIETNCRQCQTRVELEKDDIGRTWQEGDRPWEPAGYLYRWDCPLCKRTNYLGGEYQKTLLIAHPELKER